MQKFFGGGGTGGANKVYYGDVQMMNMTYTYVKKCCFGNGSLGIWECGSHCNDLFQRPPNNSLSVRNAVNHLHFSFFSLGLV